jgi:hypothetical protein
MARAAVLLSLLHTFPFVVQGTHEIRPNADGLNPHGYSQLYYSWHVKHKVCEATSHRSTERTRRNG